MEIRAFTAFQVLSNNLACFVALHSKALHFILGFFKIEKRIKESKSRDPVSRWTNLAPAAAQPCVSASAALFTTGGSVLGIQPTNVTPPARAAAVPLAKSSFSVAPGSRICTWTSMRPGRRCSRRLATQSVERRSGGGRGYSRRDSMRSLATLTSVIKGVERSTAVRRVR